MFARRRSLKYPWNSLKTTLNGFSDVLGSWKFQESCLRPHKNFPEIFSLLACPESGFWIVFMRFLPENEPKIDQKTPKIAGKRLKNHFSDMLGGWKFQESFYGVWEKFPEISSFLARLKSRFGAILGRFRPILGSSNRYRPSWSISNSIFEKC